MQTFCVERWAYLLMVLTFALITSSMHIKLLPKDIRINVSQQAIFNCSYPCAARNSHTLVWTVGNQPFNQRYFLKGRTRNFCENSGLGIEVLDFSTCKADTDEGSVLQQLRINASSAELHNRTAVQCMASRSKRKDFDFYSGFGIMIVDEEPKEESLPSPNSTTFSQVCPTPVTLIEEVPVTKEVHITLSVLPTNLLIPGLEPIDLTNLETQQP